MAAASKSYFPRANNRFLPRDQGLSKDSTIFEFDECEIWNSVVLPPSPEFRKPNPKISRKSSAAAAAAAAARGWVTGPASMPVKIPDWSKILKHEYKENRRIDFDGDDYVEDDDENGNRLPPHEFLARNRIASLSVHEGIGRTLKGRDLSRVRNAIWQKTGWIYHGWATLVKTILCPQGLKNKHFAKMQEERRKVVERAFAVLQACFARCWDVNTLSNIMRAYIVLHNMIIEDEGGLGDIEFDGNDTLLHELVSNGNTLEVAKLFQSLSRIKSSEIHSQLKLDLIEHLWRLHGE